MAEALKFADQNKNTLVVITADHETGGLTIPQGKIEKHEIEGILPPMTIRSYGTYICLWATISIISRSLREQ
ncbi:hypothetical protein Q2T40_04805 [Winogradskyella maritima]|nr:hypothetical protein [Winogradskyella maritima]